MRILAFESSAKAASVAILSDGKLLGEYFQNSGQTHSRTLMKMAQDLIDNCDLTAEDIDAVACAAGPGSFTGIRIGVAAAKGFAWGRELPLYGVSTLSSMAHNAGSFQGIVCCAMDARRSQVYNALFQAKDGGLTRLCEDRAISVEELDADLANYDQPILLVGDGAELCKTLLHVPTSLAPEQLRHQTAAGVALEAAIDIQAGKPGDGAALIPNYLRLSQAERERLAREENQKGD
ncbi:MAG: tRNA (adenosine(37)-N6)-threonylcarbamoyltransferase complex dimerization subunit type 1 TsaB [Clostridia bacterium]|nr:tRNA (adenosine(37)-N6)-threonylcarbamoyltransferase complex dimerization subunit type 1 TsaB [Clostridia bacterium]